MFFYKTFNIKLCDVLWQVGKCAKYFCRKYKYGKFLFFKDIIHKPPVNDYEKITNF